MLSFDYLIVGAGLAGSTLANLLKKSGRSVIVIDKRNHIGGNCYDFFDDSGVLIHKYGPHYFRTNYPEVKDYLSQFTDWIPQKYFVKSSINKKLFSFPINRNTLNQFFDINLKTNKDCQIFLDTKKENIPGLNPQFNTVS